MYSKLNLILNYYFILFNALNITYQIFKLRKTEMNFHANIKGFLLRKSIRRNILIYNII